MATIPQQRNKTYLDILRLVAIFLVVYNHTRGFYFLPYTGVADMGYWGLYIFDELVKMGVPLFLIISGALLLHRDEPVSVVFRKRILRFLIVTILISFIQYAISCCCQQESFDIAYFINHQKFALWECNEFYASWYLYAYLGILVVLPFLRAIAKNLTHESFLYLLILQFITFSVLPLLFLCLGGTIAYGPIHFWLPFHPYTIYIPFSAGYCIFYMLMGYYLEHRITPDTWKKHQSKLILLALACLTLGALGMEMERYTRGVSCLSQPSIYLTSFIPIPCAVFYLYIKFRFQEAALQQKTRNIIAACGAATFTIMLTENIFRVGLVKYQQFLESFIGRVPSATLFTIGLCSITMIIGLLLKRTPILKRLF